MMEATASAPVAVAGSSATHSTNRAAFINTPPARGAPGIHPQSWPTTAPKANSAPAALPNKPFTSTSDPSNIPVQHNRQTSVPDSISMTAFPPIRTNNPHTTESNNIRVLPRRRRNNGEQNAQAPQNAQASQNAQAPQNAQNAQAPQNAQNKEGSQNAQKRNPRASALLLQALQEPSSGRVLVSGYPTYTQPHDILEVFTKFGNVRIDKCNSFSATLTYATEEQAKNAISANKRLHIYGHFLSVKPYSAKLNAFETPPSPKRDFSMTKRKSMIIEPDKIDLSGDFHSQLDKILAAIRLDQEEISRITTLYRDLEHAFQSQWPGCKAIPFGSIITGLGIKTSDADCFINLPLQYRFLDNNIVNRARRLLMMYPLIFAEILAIPRANTPIVKFYHVPTDTNCDLTFKTPLGAQNSRLIAFLLHADPRITPMAVIIKYWAKVHDLSGTGKITNYTLTLMIIFYLQQAPHSILPSIEWLQRDRSNDIMVDGWNTGYMSNIAMLPHSTDKSKISELIGGFFEYYANFNFDEMVVCPYLGTTIKKVAFANTSALPNEYGLYKRNVLNNYVMPIRFQTSFCVQDPFEQCHNVASTITSRLALDIRTFFKFAAAAFEKEKSNNCAGFLPIILLQKPKLIRPKSHAEYRVNLFPRIINTIINPDWKPVVRDLVTMIFEKMLKIKLGKVEEKVNPDARKVKEKYTGSLTKAIWKRKRYNYLWNGQPESSFEEKQSFITEEIIKRETQDTALQFQLILTFCHDPKSAVASMRFDGGDTDGFREFGKFFISVMQSWFTTLLKPHAIPNCKDTAAKIAATTVGDGNPSNGVGFDDDGDKIAIIQSTKPAQKKPAEEKTSANISDFAMAEEDVPQDGASGLSQDSVVDVTKDNVANVAKDNVAGGVTISVVGVTKDSVVSVTKDNVAIVAKDGVVNATKDSVASVAKDGVVGLTKDDIVGLVKVSVGDVAKDSVAGQAKVVVAAVAKDADVVTDSVGVANDSVVNVVQHSGADVVIDGIVVVAKDHVAKDGVFGVAKDYVAEVAKGGVVGVPNEGSVAKDMPSNGTDSTSQDDHKVLPNAVDDVTQQGVHDKPLDSGDQEKVACATE